MAELPSRNAFFEIDHNPNETTEEKFKLAPLGTMVENSLTTPRQLYVKMYNNLDGKDWVVVKSGSEIKTISFQYFDSDKIKDLIIQFPFEGNILNVSLYANEINTEAFDIFLEKISLDDFKNNKDWTILSDLEVEHGIRTNDFNITGRIEKMDFVRFRSEYEIKLESLNIQIKILI